MQQLIRPTCQSKASWSSNISAPQATQCTSRAEHLQGQMRHSVPSELDIEDRTSVWFVEAQTSSILLSLSFHRRRLSSELDKRRSVNLDQVLAQPAPTHRVYLSRARAYLSSFAVTQFQVPGYLLRRRKGTKLQPRSLVHSG